MGHTSSRSTSGRGPPTAGGSSGRSGIRAWSATRRVRFRTKTGNLRSVLWSAVPITLGDRECILGWGRDITEYKYLEDELLRTQKMEAVGRLGRDDRP